MSLTPEAQLLYPPRVVTSGWAWALALLPILYLGLDVVLSLSLEESVANTVSWLAYFATNTFLSHRDSKELNKVGIEMSMWWAVFLVPVYLYRRSKILQNSQAQLAVWIAALFLNAFVLTALSSVVGTRVSTSSVEAAIADWFYTEYSISDASVDCPSAVLNGPGETFECNADADGQAFRVVVTVLNDQGDVSWMAYPAGLTA